MSTIAALTRPEPRGIRIPLTRALLYLLILAFPFFSVQPKIFRPDWWVGGALILAFGFEVLLRGRFRLDTIGKAVLGLHVAVLLSLAMNFWGWGRAQWGEFLTLWAQLVFATLLYLALSNLKLSTSQLRFLLRLWIGVAVVVALYGLYQALARNLDLPLAYLPLYPKPTEWSLQVGLGYGGYIRPSSFFSEPTYQGTYLLAPLVLAVVLVFYRQDRIWLFRDRRLNYTLLLLLLSALLVSFALAAYVTLTLLVFIALFINRFTRKLALRLFLALLVVFTALVVVAQTLEVPFIQGLITRVSMNLNALFIGEITAADPSMSNRYQEVILALLTWAHHPIFGVGLNQLQFVGRQYASLELMSWLVEQGYTHNIWLEVLVQLGAVGFFFFGLMWLLGLKTMGWVFHKSEGPLRWAALGFFFVLLATMIRGVMGGPFTFTLYWFYLGMASMIYKLARSEQHARLG